MKEIIVINVCKCIQFIWYPANIRGQIKKRVDHHRLGHYSIDTWPLCRVEVQQIINKSLQLLTVVLRDRRILSPHNFADNGADILFKNKAIERLQLLNA